MSKQAKETIRVGVPRRTKPSFVVAASYFVVASLWGLATEHLIVSYVRDPVHALRWQVARGLLFYIASTALIYGLITWYTRELERARAEAEADRRLRSVGEVSATIAHEFNNMLMAAQISADVAARKVDAGSDAANAIANVRTSLARGTMLSAKILRFTRPGAATRQPTELAEWLRQTIDDVRPQMGKTCELSCACNAPQMNANIDGVLLHQAMQNLLINARDAGAKRIDVAVRVNGAKRVTITVEDDGGGIAPEIRDRIFQPLVSTKANGTGLGLSLVYFVVREHDGEITVDSEVGRGTKFIITLPLA